MVAEIDPEVDFDSRRAVYFRQMRYGLYVSRFLSVCSIVSSSDFGGLSTDPHGAARERTRLNQEEGQKVVFLSTLTRAM